MTRILEFQKGRDYEDVQGISHFRTPELEAKLHLIVLVPKKRDASWVKDFRPTGLLNSNYKLVSKVSVNRLERTLNDLTETKQAAFIKGRQIVDGGAHS